MAVKIEPGKLFVFPPPMVVCITLRPSIHGHIRIHASTTLELSLNVNADKGVFYFKQLFLPMQLYFTV